MLTQKSIKFLFLSLSLSLFSSSKTVSDNQKTNLGRQRLQRKEKIWPGQDSDCVLCFPFFPFPVNHNIFILNSNFVKSGCSQT